MFSEKNTAQTKEDLAILQQLNLDYLSADQNSNVQRYEEFLAPEFTRVATGL